MVTFTDDVTAALEASINRLSPRGAVVVTDANVIRHVMPLLESVLGRYPVCVIPAGDENKTLDTAARVWAFMSDNGVTRNSLVINVGGGMVTDLGGFCAATFKRGVRFVNVATTLLGAVDAAVGGKTGINFHGLKNEIGLFREADEVIISTLFFATLPREELLSGYGEVIKHALLTSPDELNRTLADAPSALTLDMLRRSVALKERIVAADPTERGLRRVLNLGHTVGHALESLAMSSGCPVAHGVNVARGLVTECVISHLREGFPSASLHALAEYVRNYYGPAAITCDDYDALIEYMSHDKKNPDPSTIIFTLLADSGRPLIDRAVSRREIVAALDISRDLLE